MFDDWCTLIHVFEMDKNIESSNKIFVYWSLAAMFSYRNWNFFVVALGEPLVSSFLVVWGRGRAGM